MLDRPVLFRFYDSDRASEYLLPLAHITAVIRSDEGTEYERLFVTVGLTYSTNEPDTIKRFFSEWEIH